MFSFILVYMYLEVEASLFEKWIMEHSHSVHPNTCLPVQHRLSIEWPCLELQLGGSWIPSFWKLRAMIDDEFQLLKEKTTKVDAR